MSTIEKAGRAHDYEAEDVLVVDRSDQLRAIADDLRSKIVSLLRDRARSTQELAEELSLPKGTVGHHLKVLERAGLIRVVRTRQVRALTEKYYGRTARLFLFQAEEDADARAIGSGALRRAAEELERAPAGASFGFVRSRLAPAAARRFDRRLARLVEDFRTADTDEGVTHSLATGFWRTEARDA
jgi:DNA-binding transcriptional ArsR family regulator